MYAGILHADFQQAVLFERDGVRFADRLPVLLVGQHEVCFAAFRADILIRIDIDSVAVEHIVVSRIVCQLVGIGQQVCGEEPALARSGGVCLSRMADLVVFRIAARHDGSRDPLDTYPVVLFRVFYLYVHRRIALRIVQVDVHRRNVEMSVQILVPQEGDIVRVGRLYVDTGVEGYAVAGMIVRAGDARDRHSVAVLVVTPDIEVAHRVAAQIDRTGGGVSQVVGIGVDTPDNQTCCGDRIAVLSDGQQRLVALVGVGGYAVGIGIRPFVSRFAQVLENIERKGRLAALVVDNAAGRVHDAFSLGDFLGDSVAVPVEATLAIRGDERDGGGHVAHLVVGEVQRG